MKTETTKERLQGVDLKRLVRWFGWLAMLAMVVLHGLLHLPGAAIVWLIAGRMDASNWFHDETDQGIEWLVKNFPANASGLATAPQRPELD